LVLGITRGLVLGITRGLVLGITRGLVLGITRGLVLGITRGLVLGIIRGLVLGIVRETTNRSAWTAYAAAPGIADGGPAACGAARADGTVQPRHTPAKNASDTHRRASTPHTPARVLERDGAVRETPGAKTCSHQFKPGTHPHAREGGASAARRPRAAAARVTL
jgi:hypothetical protein